MTTTLVLLAVVLGLLFVLEVLNALYDSILEGLYRDLSRKEPVPPWLLPAAFLRYGLAVLSQIGGKISLWIHELSHAGAQLLFGGRPRVVLLKNGGYAQASPWIGWLPARIVYAIGGCLGQGVMSMAPILVGSTLLVATLVAITPLEVADLFAFGRAIAQNFERALAWDIARATWHAFADGRWWVWPVAALVSLMLAPSMTPSSVDYVHGRLHLLLYSIAALACTGIADRAPGALWVVAPIALAIGVGAVLFAPMRLKNPIGGVSLATGALALALAVIAWRTDYSALLALHTALVLVAYALSIAAVVFVVWVVGFLALSLLAIRPRTLWYTLRAVPGHLIDLFRMFHTCDTCGIHYRGKCDGCGRTPDQPAERERKAA